MSFRKILFRRDTAANWTSTNPTLSAGEIGLEIDTNKIKLGTGSSVWTSLPYFYGSLDNQNLNDLADVTIVSASNGDFLRWNGSAWINDAVNLSTDTVGNYMVDVAGGTGVTVTHTPGEGSSASIAIGQAVEISSSVTFAAVTAPLIGNASTASALQTSRAINLAGDLSGSASFDGSTNVTITADVQPNSIALGTDTTGNFVNDVVSGTGVTVTHTPGEGSSASIAIGQDVATSASVTFAAVTAPVVGNASTATTLQTARAISLAGDLSGSASFNGSQNVTITADVQPNSVALGTDTTGNYMTDVVAGTGISITHTPGEGSSASISVGQDVSTSASVTFGQVTISGDLTVSGTTTTLNTENLTIEDNIIVLNSNVTGEPVTNAGIEIERGDSANVQLRWNETTNSWETTDDGSIYKNIAVGQDVETSSSVTFAAVSAPLTGNVTGDVTGNASTATTLQTARSISLAGDLSGSASFSGGSDITITASVEPNSVALGADTTGNFVADVVSGTGVTVTHTPGESSSASIAIGQDVATTASVAFAHVSAPVTGNVTGNLTGNVTGDATGNAGTATALQTSRSISLSGDLSGSASFNGTSDITITASVEPNSVALGTDTTGNYVNDVTAGTGVSVTHTPGEGSSPTIAIGQAVGTSSSVTFAHVSAPLTGNVTGDLTGNVTGNVSGNAGTATALQNSRTISLGGDLSGSVSFNGTSDVTITATVQPDSVALGTDTTGNYMSGVTAGTGVTVTHTPGEGSSATVAIGQAVGTSDNPSFAGVTADGVQIGISASAEIDTTAGNLVIDSAGGTVTIDDNLIVSGDLTVNGTTTTVNTETINLADNIITLNSNETSTPSQNAGIEVERGTSTNVALRWNETSDKWELTEDGSTYSDIATASSVATATALTVDNLTDVVITAAANKDFLMYDGNNWVDQAITLGTDTTGNYVADVVSGTGITISHTPGEGSSASVALNATLDDLSNVTAPSPSDGQFLKYVSASSAWVPAAVPTINALDDIADVNAPAPTTGYFLKWDGTEWVPAAAGGAVTTTSITTASETEIYSFDATLYGTAEVTLQVKQGSKKTSSRQLVNHNGTTASLTEYAKLEHGSPVIPATLGVSYIGAATTWTTRTSNFGETSITSVAYGNGLWVAGGGYRNGALSAQIRTSTDAITWVTQTSNFSTSAILSVAYGNSLWVAVGGVGQLRTSTDAITWTTRTSNFGTSVIRSVAYGNNLWVAGGRLGELRTSTDAITWVTQTSNFPSDITSVAYDDNLWVAGGYIAAIRTSTDAITWTTQTSNFGNTRIFSVAYGNSLWVAGGSSGQLRTSTDAITWTTQTSNFGNTQINSVAYGNNVWVAGGGYFGGDGAMRTSTDAITWTTRTSNFGNTQINSVAYANSLWVAGGYTGQIRTSSGSSKVSVTATITDANVTTATSKATLVLTEE